MRISDWSSDVCSSDLSYIGMVRRMGPPVPGIDAVKSPRRHELIHKRGTDTAAASDHQGALDAHMLLLPAMTSVRHPDALNRRQRDIPYASKGRSSGG